MLNLPRPAGPPTTKDSRTAVAAQDYATSNSHQGFAAHQQHHQQTLMVAASFQNRKKSSSGYLAKGGIRGVDKHHRVYKNPTTITGATSAISNTGKPSTSLTRRDSNNTVKHIQ